MIRTNVRGRSRAQGAPARGSPTRRRAVKKIAARAVKYPLEFSVGHGKAELSLALVGNAEMRHLNAKYRKKGLSQPMCCHFPIDGKLCRGRSSCLGMSLFRSIRRGTGKGARTHAKRGNGHTVDSRHRASARLRSRTLGQVTRGRWDGWRIKSTARFVSGAFCRYNLTAKRQIRLPERSESEAARK